MARLELDLEAEDARVLRGALLAAKASELASIQRRDTRLFLGYGADSSRDDMTSEMTQHRRRIDLLDRILSALDERTEPEPGSTV